MSRLRARCPDCRTLTAVAWGEGYECHSCGREFRAGLVRVPRAWGEGGEEMAEAANLPLPYPEALVVEEETLREQNLALAAGLPARPVVLGGCCCAHVGAIAGLASRYDRLAVVWLDAHGDLNTPATSPSGNEWGMPLRMLLDSGTIATEDVALVAARSLDPPEREFIASVDLPVGADGVARALEGADAVYVAFD
ncbi:MAG: arginase family protein, partial [Actinobacteria bacterium]|nr:arginase family protein [Actinomycetota bacterium]